MVCLQESYPSFQRSRSTDTNEELIVRVLAGDAEAREQMIVNNIGLVMNVAKRYAHTSMSLEDLIQTGMIGLCGAVDGYNPSKARFSSYATAAITNEILTSFKDNFGLVKLYPELSLLRFRIGEAQRALRYKLNRKPTTTEIADFLDLPEKKILAALDYFLLTQSMTMDNPDNNPEESDFWSSLSTSPENPTSDHANQISKLLELLTEKERFIIERYFGLNGARLDLSEIAEDLKIHKERVRVSLKMSLRKLRNLAKK